MKRHSILLALAGLTLATAVIGWFGFDRVVAAALSVGWAGFAGFAAMQVLLFGILGLAWNAIMPASALGIVTWGRMVRDATANCLPFTVMGGILAGARSIAARGVSWPLALGSSVVDVTAEFLAQIGFVALGLVLLLWRTPGSPLVTPAAIALAAALAGGASFVGLQLGAARLFRAVARRIAGEQLAAAGARLERFQAELSALYENSGRLALGAAIHLVGWVGTGVLSWVAYRLLGASVELGSVISLEALLQLLVTAAFLIPGAIGVQEAGYASIGAAFGLPPELSLGVSLLRRARDLVLGVPILLIWQFAEARRTIRSPVPGRL